jgi:hypothetical protein
LFGKEEGDNRPLQAYARYLSANKANVEQFITRLKFDLTASNPKLFFKPMRWLTPEEYEITVKQGLTDDAVRAVTMTVSQADNAPKLPEGMGKPLPPKAAPKKEPEPPTQAAATDDEPPPPAPKPAAKPAKPAAAKPAAAKPAAATDDEPPPPEPKVRASVAEAPVLPQRAKISEVAAQWDADD